jgi:hypothetical protein
VSGGGPAMAGRRHGTSRERSSDVGLIMGSRPPAGELRLEHEAKLVDLVGDAAGRRLEASGVLTKGDAFYVVFDNLPHIVRLGRGLVAGAPENHVFTQERREADGFEDIAHDPGSDRFFTLIEGLQARPGSYRAKVHQYDGSLRYLRSDWLDFPLPDVNKGLEGLTCLRRNGRTCLLAVCEGNRCQSGSAGRRPGGGRIQVFTEAGPRGGWAHTGTIRLPRALEFEDYSSISVAGDRLAVVSQASSALWIGRLRREGQELVDEIVDDGTVFRFPTDARGPTVYRTVEGVSWLGDDRVVVVSDKVKPGSGERSGRAKDQSIHIFAIPTPPAAGARP